MSFTKLGALNTKHKSDLKTDNQLKSVERKKAIFYVKFNKTYFFAILACN